nr:MAG TPA: hypothetical protein [Caudoviricetes sp.]
MRRWAKITLRQLMKLWTTITGVIKTTATRSRTKT